MSDEKQRMPYARALELALAFIEDIRDGCERIEIAGSLRRKKAEVGDIEVVCIPKIVQGVDLFGGPGEKMNLLDERLGGYRIVKGGEKYKQIALASINIDLFIQPDPATWGVNLAIRTGSADFSHWLVTWRRNGGALPGNMWVREARLYSTSGIIDTPEEREFFRAIGLDWIEPEERTAGRWAR